MRASEVLAKYAKRERNFQGINLRGQSFKDEDISGADFSEADLRGANFTGANLRGVNFTGAKCGLQKRWVILGMVITSVLAFVSGFFTLLASLFIALIFFDPSC